jgi:hypothetical protein
LEAAPVPKEDEETEEVVSTQEEEDTEVEVSAAEEEAGSHRIRSHMDAAWVEEVSEE